MRFSIITVAYNPGEKLRETLESVMKQTFTDYEVVVKDGGSTDGSAAFLQTVGEAFERVRFFAEKDEGIYDAMNRAVGYARGEYLLFLNCGDYLADERVLERTADVIGQAERASDGIGSQQYIFYGDTLSRQTKVRIASAPEITGFTCYRNIPCHQSCFYRAELCRRKPYELRYRIRADYDHFLWCFYRGGAKFVRMDFAVASYEGGGYSENAENRKRDRQEHKQITSAYMTWTELLKYRAVMALTLAPLRRFLAENRKLSGVYHRLKEAFYSRDNVFRQGER